MAVNTSRSMNASLDEGATDGAYRKVRPHTQVVHDAGNEATLDDKQSLHSFAGYGFAASEHPNKRNPAKF